MPDTDTNTTRSTVPSYSVFATRLRHLRMQANLKQEDMARMLSIHRSAYTKYETDRAAPDYEGLILLADFFDVSVDFLLGHEHDLMNDTHPLLLEDNTGYLMLDVREQTLIAAFRQLPDERRTEIVEACRDEARKQKDI